jgi:hypothetical protein
MAMEDSEGLSASLRYVVGGEDLQISRHRPLAYQLSQVFFRALNQGLATNYPRSKWQFAHTDDLAHVQGLRHG